MAKEATRSSRFRLGACSEGQQLYLAMAKRRGSARLTPQTLKQWARALETRSKIPFCSLLSSLCHAHKVAVSGFFAKTTRESRVFWLFFKQTKNPETLHQAAKWAGVFWKTLHHEVAGRITGAGNTSSYGHLHSTTVGWTSVAGPKLIPACCGEPNAGTKPWEKRRKIGKTGCIRIWNPSEKGKLWKSGWTN